MTEERFRNAGVRGMLRKHSSASTGLSEKIRGRSGIDHCFKIFFGVAGRVPDSVKGSSTSKDCSMGEGVESLSSAE